VTGKLIRDDGTCLCPTCGKETDLRVPAPCEGCVAKAKEYVTWSREATLDARQGRGTFGDYLAQPIVLVPLEDLQARIRRPSR
jgi:hypothetical protein